MSALTECQICQEDLNNPERLTVIAHIPIKNAQHKFHKDCLEMWRYSSDKNANRKKCPSCREQINIYELPHILFAKFTTNLIEATASIAIASITRHAIIKLAIEAGSSVYDEILKKSVATGNKINSIVIPRTGQLTAKALKAMIIFTAFCYGTALGEDGAKKISTIRRFIEDRRQRFYSNPTSQMIGRGVNIFAWAWAFARQKDLPSKKINFVSILTGGLAAGLHSILAPKLTPLFDR